MVWQTVSDCHIPLFKSRGMLTSTSWCLLGTKKTKKCQKKSKKTPNSTYKTEKIDINSKKRQLLSEKSKKKLWLTGTDATLKSICHSPPNENKQTKWKRHRISWFLTKSVQCYHFQKISTIFKTQQTRKMKWYGTFH